MMGGSVASLGDPAEPETRTAAPAAGGDSRVIAAARSAGERAGELAPERDGPHAAEPDTDERLRLAEERWRAGAQVGRYAIRRRLGTGGFGVTVLAERQGPPGTHFEKAVCLKILRPDRSADPEFVARLLDEAKLQAALRHDGIVDVYDFHVADGDFVIEMEFVDGVTLSRFITSYPEGAVPLETAAFVMGRLLRAAAWMHEAEDLQGRPLQLVHRDLKPANVFLGRNGSVKIGDFGLAKGVGRQFITQDSIGRGTVRYMPPEQIKPSCELDGRTDVYALGVMLYEMLSGRKHPARHHRLPVDVACMVATLEPARVPLREVAPEVPPLVAQLVDRMVAHDMAVRPSAREALAELVDAVRVTSHVEEAALGKRVGDLLHGRAVAALAVRPARAGELTAQVGGAPAAREVRSRRWLALVASGALGFAGAGAWALRDRLPLRGAQAAQHGAASEVREPASAREPEVREPALVREPAPSPAPEVPPAAPDDLVSTQRELAGARRTRPAARAAEAAGLAAAPEIARTAWLDVTVPGAIGPCHVWVDGQYFGTADVSIKVPPGRHAVQVGADAPGPKRMVRVAAGARRTVTMVP
jgi:Protein kinase domain